MLIKNVVLYYVYMKFKGKLVGGREKYQSYPISLFPVFWDTASGSIFLLIHLEIFRAFHPDPPFPESSPCYHLSSQAPSLILIKTELPLALFPVPAFPRSSPNHPSPPYVLVGAFRKQFLNQNVE